MQTPDRHAFCRSCIQQDGEYETIEKAKLKNISPRDLFITVQQASVTELNPFLTSLQNFACYYLIGVAFS